MTVEEKIKYRKTMRNWAVKISGGCTVQQGDDGQTYPCGSCFCAGLGQLIDEKKADYKEHNEPVDRINEVWRFLLQLRDEEYKAN